MITPKGFDIDQGNVNAYSLQLHNNVYGQKQSGQEVVNQYLVKKTNQRTIVSQKLMNAYSIEE
jgi:hypothetical protein